MLRRSSVIASWRGRAGRVAAAGVTLAVFGAIGASSAQASTPDVLSIFAGTGAYGTPTPGPATSSALGAVQAVAVDSSGNVYIADSDAYVVEKVTPSGTLSIVAGNGSYGPATPGPATSSDLKGPVALAVNAAGDVYIADASNEEIEKVTPGGALSIVAGTGSAGAPTPGAATSSDLSDPFAVAVDPSGNLFIDDEGNNEIEKVTPGGTLSIFAGTGSQGPAVAGPATSSGMGDVRGLATDASGEVYIADDYNAEVEKVTPSGTLSVIAGNGNYGTETPGPALSSMLANPGGMAIDSAGDLYFADVGNNVVEEITPSGTLSVIAGTGTQGAPTARLALSSDLSQPSGVALDPAGDAYYIADYGNSVVEKVAPPTPAATTQPSISGTVAVGQTLTASPGSWSNTPTGYGYQWQDCDSSGANCIDISGATSGTYTVTGGDVGHTIRVVVTAENGGGSNTDNSAVTVAVPGPAIPTTTSTSSPTPTPAPTPGGSVAVSAGAIPSTGVVVNDHGQVMLTLVCPITPSGCDASGVLTIHLPNSLEAHTANAITANVADAGGTVLASFSGRQIASGQSTLVAVRLSANVLRQLQTVGIRRVKVTLSLSNHLTGAPAVNSTQTVFLLVPALPDTVCPSATGQLRGTTLGPVRLGRTRALTRRLLPRYSVYSYHTDNYCLYDGRGIRVGYASTRLLGRANSALVAKGDTVFALSSNRYYSLDGVRPGTRVATAARHLKLGKVIHSGLNYWYVIAGRRSNGIMKVRHGIILGVGIVNRRITRTRSAQLRLLRNF